MIMENDNNSIHIYDIYGNQMDNGKSGWRVEIVESTATQSVSDNKEIQEGNKDGSR